MKCIRRTAEIGLLLVCLIGAVWLLYNGYQRYLRACYPNAFEAQVTDFAQQYDLSPSLVMAVIHTESKFETDALSSAGAIGLMQLTEDTFQWAQMRQDIPESERLDETALYEADTNIHYGCAVLSLLGEEFQSEDTVLAAYNAGFGNVREWLADSRYSDDQITLKCIPFTETENYVHRVRNAQAYYQRLYGYR